MRISTTSIYEAGATRLSDLQSALMKTQQQLSSNRRVLTPADDPVAAAQALDVTQAQSVNSQYGVNRQSAKSSLNMVESAMGGMTLLLQDVRTLAVSAGNTATLSDSDRKAIAAQISERLDELISFANSSDGKGNYLFSGYQTATQPFTKTVTGAQYNGDQGERLLQVGASRQLAISEPGDAVFNGIKTILTAAVAGNTGTGVISAGSVTNSSALTGHTYSIDFSGGGTSYSVFDTTLDPTKAGTPLTTGTYAAGQTIAFAGQQFEVSGAPANGDSFTIAPSNNQSVFKTLTDFINVLQTPGTTNLNAGVKAALGNIDQASENILTLRASVGSRLAEIDSLDSAGDLRNIQYAETLSGLVDLDYAKAISDFTMQQTTLEAAQKSFVAISGLSLFKLL